ncbi:hypothetical protein AGMMS50268_03360 [Spirochaetia bacterium]|nr:hypothetical protein AGMMS50268_03360 [Spirochaetia bacterium]
MIVLAGVMGPAASGLEGAVFPALVFGAANALFLLMALFMWLDFVRYRAYATLYTAGKALTAVSALVWCIFSRAQITNAVYMDDTGFLVVFGGLLAVIAGDMLSLCGGAALLNKLKRVDAALQPAAAENGGL